MLAGCADGGDAVSLLQVSAARVEVGKNGLTADGRIPSIEVESDGYWRVFAESSAAWVRTDPSAASGSCTVTLSVEANDGPARTAVLRIGCGDGTTQEVEVRQEGAGSRLRYYEDSFGAGADEAVAPSDYEDFRVAGCGALETVYGPNGRRWPPTLLRRDTKVRAAAGISSWLRADSLRWDRSM